MANNVIDLYLNLLKDSLTNLTYIEFEEGSLDAEAQSVRRKKRYNGRDWPPFAVSMVGLPRLNNIQTCVEHIIEEDIPGDLLEAGTWRGGASIFMRGLLAAYGIFDRSVWVADSFEGLPRPKVDIYPQDSGSRLHERAQLRVSLEEVKANFRRYRLLDEHVKFIKGFFSDTLPTAPVEQLALLRLDGDMYESTLVSLDNLYDKLSPGGFVIVDDYFCLHSCQDAVDDFLRANHVVPEIKRIDWTGVYWQKT